ncbi:MAG TPA: hypothetical protein VIY47_14700 [Ignavibacteriaceae bacterium]
MKKAFILLVAIGLIGTCAFAQTTTDSLYIVTYTTGPAWDKTKVPNEQPYFTDHSANLGKLRKEGVITAGARYGEKGIIFIKASSLQAAREIILADQAVVNKLFNADVQKLNVFYDGCIERPKKN